MAKFTLYQDSTGAYRYSVTCRYCKARWMELATDRYLLARDHRCEKITDSVHAQIFKRDPSGNQWIENLFFTAAVRHKRTDRPTKCGAKCQNAKLSDCDCACGAVNHGAGKDLAAARAAVAADQIAADRCTAQILAAGLPVDPLAGAPVAAAADPTPPAAPVVESMRLDVDSSSSTAPPAPGSPADMLIEHLASVDRAISAGRMCTVHYYDDCAACFRSADGYY